MKKKIRIYIEVQLMDIFYHRTTYRLLIVLTALSEIKRALLTHCQIGPYFLYACSPPEVEVKLYSMTLYI